MVEVAGVARYTVNDAGFAEIVKSGGGTTVKENV